MGNRIGLRVTDDCRYYAHLQYVEDMEHIIVNVIKTFSRLGDY